MIVSRDIDFSHTYYREICEKKHSYLQSLRLGHLSFISTFMGRIPPSLGIKRESHMCGNVKSVKYQQGVHKSAEEWEGLKGKMLLAAVKVSPYGFPFYKPVSGRSNLISRGTPWWRFICSVIQQAFYTNPCFLIFSSSLLHKKV